MRAFPLSASIPEPKASGARVAHEGNAPSDEAVASPPGELGQLYDDYFPLVWRTLRRFGVDESSLDDAAQDVFMVALRREAEFRQESSYRTWLFGIAVNVAREYRRKNLRFVALPESCANEPVSASTPLDHVSQQEALRFLEAFLARLDDARRTVFVMVELEQIPAPEIARALGVNLNTVYSRLRSARQAFVTALNKQTPGASR